MLPVCRISTCFHSHPGNPIDVSKVLVCRHKIGTCLHRVGCNPDVVDGNGPPLGLQRRHHSGIAVRSYWSDRYKGHVGTFEEGSEFCKVPIEVHPLPKAVKQLPYHDSREQHLFGGLYQASYRGDASHKRGVGIGASYQYDISILKDILWYSVDMKIHRAAAFAARIGVHKNTAKAWSLKGKLPDVERYFGVEHASEAGRTVVYCRVSNRAQGNDLRSQPQAMETFRLGAGLAVDEWRPEIGGGPDFRRPVFRSLRERMEHRGLGLVPAAHEDRPRRFGFDWFAYFAETHGCEIRVVNQPSLSPQAELVEDLMAVVDIFSGRLYGLRRYRKQIREAVSDG